MYDTTPIRQLLGTIAILCTTFAGTSVFADSKKVEVSGPQMTAIDTLVWVSREGCASMVSDAKVMSPAKHGQLMVRKVSQKLTEGPCKGRTVRFYAVGYQPKRGFKGGDQAVVTYRSPPRVSTMAQLIQVQSRHYEITVK